MSVARDCEPGVQLECGWLRAEQIDCCVVIPVALVG